MNKKLIFINEKYYFTYGYDIKQKKNKTWVFSLTKIKNISYYRTSYTHKNRTFYLLINIENIENLNIITQKINMLIIKINSFFCYEVLKINNEDNFDNSFNLPL